MMIYKCLACDQRFSSKQALNYHEKMNVCKDNESKKCVCECGQRFSFRSGLCRHRKTCTGKQISLEDEVIELREKVRQYEADESRSSVINNSHAHINSHNTTNIETQNINIHINNFGFEAVGYLFDLGFEELKKVLKLTPDHESLLRMLQYINMNKNHPENHTFKLAEVDNENVVIRHKGKWKEENCDEHFYSLIDSQCARFSDLEDILETGMSKAKYNALRQYLLKAEEMAQSQDKCMHSDEYNFSALLTKAKELAVEAGKSGGFAC